MNRTLKYLIRISTSASLCLLLCANWGCAKYTAECEVIVMPRLSTAPGNPTGGTAFMVKMYAWYIPNGDIHNWRPNSYAEAQAGIVTHATSGNKRSHNLVAGQGADNYVHIKITKSPVLLVAVDEFDEMYAWRTFEYEIPAPKVYIPVHFFTYRPTAENPSYDDGNGKNKWTVVGARYE